MLSALISLVVLSGLLMFSQLSPGPDVFFVFRTALAQGFRAGVAVGSGIAAGFLIQASLVAWVGGWVVAQPWSQYVLYAAAVWLLFLAWKIFPRQAGAVGAAQLESADRATLPVLFWQGFLCNILNPKCTLFICGLSVGPLGQFSPLHGWYAPVLVLVLTFSCLLGWALWSALLQWRPVRGFYLAHARGIDVLFSVLLAIFALLLVLPH